MLGYNRGVPTLSSAFQVGFGRIWLNDVRCHGEESYIQDCQHSDWGSYSSSCTSSTDAGVICFSENCMCGILYGLVIYIYTYVYMLHIY